MKGGGARWSSRPLEYNRSFTRASLLEVLAAISHRHTVILSDEHRCDMLFLASRTPHGMELALIHLQFGPRFSLRIRRRKLSTVDHLIQHDLRTAIIA